MSINTETDTEKLASATKLVAGMQKHFPNAQSFAFGSQSYTPAQITAASQQLVTLITGVDAAQSAVKVKVAAKRAQSPALLSLLAGFASYVSVTFSASPDVLADFGLAPKKAATPLSAEEKAVAVVRRASTRQARGITSKKAKKSVKGSVVNAVLVPVVASAPVVSTPSTATSVPANGNATGGTTPHGA